MKLTKVENCKTRYFVLIALSLLPAFFQIPADSLADPLDGILTSDQIQDTTIKWTPADTSYNTVGETNSTRTYPVGVPGGIDSHNFGRIVLNVPPPTGGNDQALIQNVINSAPENSIVQLQAGTYRIDNGIGIGENKRSNITIRGAGQSLTLLDCRVAGNTCVGLDGTYGNDAAEDPVIAGVAKGSDTLTLGSVSPYQVGDLVQIVVENDYNLPALSTYGFRKVRYQLTKVVGVNSGARTITIKPAIMAKFDPAKTTVRRAKFSKVLRNVGLEDLSIDGSVGGTPPQTGISISVTDGSWIRNVDVKGVTNYPIVVYDNLNCELRRNVFRPTSKTLFTSNGAGILLHADSSCLFEDNIALKLFPIVEVNETSMGNVFAYNFFTGGHINTNHGPHNSFNLFEGNFTEGFQSDGYFGGESEATIFRNRIISYISNKRFSRNFNILGNVMFSQFNAATYRYGTVQDFMFRSILGDSTGNAVYKWLMDNNFTTQHPNLSDAAKFLVTDLDAIQSALATSIYSSLSTQIMAILHRGNPGYEFGRPNIGNSGYDGYVQPSKGRPWRDWNPAVSQYSGLTIIGDVRERGLTVADPNNVGKTLTYFVLQIRDSAMYDRLYSYARNLCWRDSISDITHPSTCQTTLGIDWTGENNYFAANAVAFDRPNNKVFVTEPTPTRLDGVTTVGVWPRSEGFQELDLDVEATTVTKANWFADANGGGKIFSSEAISGSLPTSLYRTTKPSFWPSGLAWPPYDSLSSTPNTQQNSIPAGQRFLQTGICAKEVHLCDSGTPTNISDTSSNYVWTCSGTNGYPSEQCSVSRSVDDGICDTTTVNSCAKGTANTTSSNSTGYQWYCQGPNGGGNAHCSYTNQAPTLVNVTISSTTAIPEFGSKLFTLTATDDHQIASLALFNNVGGTLVPLPSQDLTVSSATYVSGNQWTANVTWTPKLSGTYNLVAKAADDLGTLSANSSSTFNITVTTNSMDAPILQVTPSKPILSGNPFTLSVLNKYNTQSAKNANFIVQKIVFSGKRSTDSVYESIGEVSVPADYQAGQAAITITTPPLEDGAYTLEAAAEVLEQGVPTTYRSHVTRIVLAKSLNNEPDLIDWWKLNDGSGTTAHDTSLHTTHNDGTITGATWVDDTRGGSAVKALSFDGSDLVSAGLNVSNYPITGCVWIKPDQAGGITQNIINMLGFNLYKQSNGVNGVGAAYQLGLYNGHEAVSSAYGTITPNVWQHLCGVISEKHSYDNLYSGKIYVNGTQVGSSDALSDFSYAGSIQLGNSYVGKMSDVRIYSRALSPTELGELYLKPPPILSKPSAPQNLRAAQ